MWNIASGRSLFALSNQTYHEAVFVADGTRLLTLNNGRRLAAWDSNSGALLAENPQLPNSPSQLRLSPDGQFISLVNVAGEVLILEAQSLVLLQTLPLATSNSSVLGVYFSPDGRRLTAFTNEGRMLTWETQAWTVLEERELGRSILALTATFDHRSVALAHLDSWSRYSLDDGRWQTDFPLPPFREVRAMEFSQDGQWLALGGDLDSALIVDSQTGDWVVTLRGHSQFFSDLALSPNRALILTGVANGGVYLWDLGQFLNQSLSAEQVQVPRAILGQMGPDFRLSDLAWGQDGNYIVLADQRGPVYVLALPE
jgi:WD40 repeat protein